MPKIKTEADQPLATGESAAGDNSAEESEMSPEETERHGRIAIAAYFKAEQRAFAPGMEMNDWLEAEREVEEA